MPRIMNKQMKISASFQVKFVGKRKPGNGINQEDKYRTHEGSKCFGNKRKI